jgi:hypothetical protein
MNAYSNIERRQREMKNQNNNGKNGKGKKKTRRPPPEGWYGKPGKIEIGGDGAWISAKKGRKYIYFGYWRTTHERRCVELGPDGEVIVDWKVIPKPE